MRELAMECVTRAALAAGLPEGRVFDVSRKDNLTQPRPRLEVQYLPEKLTRTGRKLGVTRANGRLTRKREVYAVELSVLVNVLAEDEGWLAGFGHAFLAALPRGLNDARGNWVKVRAVKAEYQRAPAPRVGITTIEPLKRVGELYNLTFTGRVTAEETEPLITSITINPPRTGGTHGQGQD